MTAVAKDVLVLNRYFSALRIVGVQVAFGLLFRGAAEVVLAEDGSMASIGIESWLELSRLRELFDEDGRWIRTPSLDVRIPSVIRLLGYARAPAHRVRFSRRNILLRDASTCQYCGRVFPARELTFDHVVPRSRGGRTCWENIVCAGIVCNQKKADRTPREARMRLVRQPARPRVSPDLRRRFESNMPATWRHFADAAYWGIALEQD